MGDIHGCYTALEDGLRHIGFNFETDRLFSVGDLVDRGPESDQVLDWLNKPWFHAIQGNHDMMAWRQALGFPYPHVNMLNHGGEWILDIPQAKKEAIGMKLHSLPVMIEVETAAGNIGLVHADCPSDDWQDMHSQLSKEDLHACLWSVARIEQDYTAPVKNIRAVIHGHFRMPKAKTLGNVYFIDTVGWPRNGHFTFVELESLTLEEGPEAHASYPEASIF